MNESTQREYARSATRSVNLFFLGSAFLFGTQGYHTALSDHARIILLVSGFLLISFAAVLRFGWITNRHTRLLGLSLAVVSVLVALQVALEQDTVNTRLFLFQFIVYALFIAGALLGAGGRRALPPPSSFIIVLSGLIVLPGLYFFFQYAEEQMADPFRHLRSYDVEGLHPIGVAYTASLLVIIYSRAAFSNKSFVVRAVSLLVIIASTLALVVSGSRGAFLYIVLTGLLMLWVLRRGFPRPSARISVTGATRFLATALLILLVATFIASSAGDVIGLRWDWFLGRLERVTQLFSGGTTDQAISDRQAIWVFYLENWHLALPFGMHGYQGYPHNMFLEFFGRFGVFGIALAIWVVMVLARAVLATRASTEGVFKNGESLMLLAMLIFAFLQSMSSLSLEMNRALFLGLGYFSGFLLARRRYSSLNHIEPRR